MNESIFREYDIRGVVGTELLLDQVYDLVSAIAYYYIHKNPRIKKIALGMDGRIHSAAIKKATSAALTDSGLEVIFVGVCPSPVVNFALHTISVDGGIMITASHNPKEYNGFKMSLGIDPVWGSAIKEIEKLYRQKKRVVAHTRGTESEYPLVDSYVTWLVDHFQHLKHMDLSVLIDCGNGAAGTVLPQLVTAFQWPHVKLLYEEVDGTYPNHEADPTVVANMKDLVHQLAQGQYDFGLGLDGDCDRMTPMINTGQLVLGDVLLALFAHPILQQHPGATVVFDIKSSSGLIELLDRWGAVACVSATGHTNIKEQMKQQCALLGGELSCHFFFKDRYFGYDDGIYAMLRLFEYIINTGRSLSDFLSVFPHTFSSPEYRITCPDDRKREIVDRVKQLFAVRNDVQIITLDGVRVMWSDGWGLLRASNTQPILSFRFEGKTSDALHRIKQEFITALRDELDERTLQRQLEYHRP